MSDIDDVVKRVSETKRVGLIIIWETISSDDSVIRAFFDAFVSAREIRDKTYMVPTIVPVVMEDLEEGKPVEAVVRPLRVGDNDGV